MPVTIGSNIASLKAQRQLGKATDALSSTFEKLSSGQRINKASDDAAGLAIADSLSAKTRVYSQGIRNINDGLSLTNIAEGAVRSLSDIVIRQKELAEQAANGTYGVKQRVALNKEAYALTQEYNRIIQSTTFNGVQVLDGTDDTVRIQGGFGSQESTVANIGQAIGVAAGDGTLHRVGFAENSGALAPYSSAVADLNGDGNNDIVTGDGAAPGIYIALGNGDGTFGGGGLLTGGSGPTSINAEDLNGDGFLDLLSSNSIANTLSYFLGKGDGTFGSEVTLVTGLTPYKAIVADYNNDGNLDVIAANFAGNTLSVFQGHGDGTFSFAATLTTGTGPYEVAVHDLNGDGIADIVDGDFSGNQVSIFLGNGDGTFRARKTLATGANPQGLSVADLNNDGIPDLVTSDRGANQISYFLGNGNGTFSTQRTLATGSLPWDVTTADLNGDGYEDLISGDRGDPSLSVFINKGNGTFNSRISIGLVNTVQDVVAADLNNDGAIDIVGTGNVGAIVFLGTPDSTGRHNNLQTPLDLTSIQGARAALDKTTKLLINISQELSNIGVSQRRLQISSSNLAVRSENYNAARSRVTDADIAQESANLVRGQILQQAGAAVLSQANLQPNIASKLISS